jgi:Pyruvate kinase
MSLGFEIIATMGPSSSSVQIINGLIEHGVTAFRFPFSKETPQWQVKQAKTVKSVASGLNKNVKVIMDLPGNQPRTLNREAIHLLENDKVYFIYGSKELVSEEKHLIINIDTSEALGEIKVGSIIVAGDGEIAFQVTETGSGYYKAVSLLSGCLKQMRGLTVEGRGGAFESFSFKDREYLMYNKELLFDKILVSFVDRSKEVNEIRDYLHSILGSSVYPEIVSKIETVDAIKNIEDIIRVSDQLLIGRGDLALQSGIKDFYRYQMNAISMARKHNKPVYIGTQLMESADTNWTPYRAELSDICHLISSGIHGVMLSAETTVSQNPVKIVSLISKLFEEYGGQ